MDGGGPAEEAQILVALRRQPPLVGGTADRLSSDVAPPDFLAAGSDQGAVPFFTLPQRLFGLLALGHITPDSLKTDDHILSVQEGMIGPLVPADLPIRQEHLVLVTDHTGLCQQRLDMAKGGIAGSFRDELKKAGADQ